MRPLRQMLRLHHDGVSVRAIGRRLGLARSTIQGNLKCVSAWNKGSSLFGPLRSSTFRQLGI
jgi:lambda repressor-like predicted transcriptional regulator